MVFYLNAIYFEKKMLKWILSLLTLELMINKLIFSPDIFWSWLFLTTTCNRSLHFHFLAKQSILELLLEYQSSGKLLKKVNHRKKTQIVDQNWAPKRIRIRGNLALSTVLVSRESKKCHFWKDFGKNYQNPFRKRVNFDKKICWNPPFETVYSGIKRRIRIYDLRFIEWILIRPSRSG